MRCGSKIILQTDLEGMNWTELADLYESAPLGKKIQIS